HPWRSLRYLSIAVSGRPGQRTLHIPVDPQGASLLQHDHTVGERFGRNALFDIEHRVEVTTQTLDAALLDRSLPCPHYLKLDVEGAELEILRAANQCMESLVAIKAEAAFLHQRVGQPLAWDLVCFMNDMGFELSEI